ncbi:MAG: glycogen/starch/alpha-glucan phosphorylase [Candidatus Omnitrophica bacterium]|nr:glycogen/starch/alpha-glucan phosphorylase [Candidatus Omnitrophota bacterium]MDE2008922.1 glycogen/starch/alpha-glucan phosphorylase [Candidatus Omnitrophota bacterium]MDE2213515.1 glycogen/starch/alpha-glucan phosphorylase [Candidatus Omnitrophota bacterium]MDE2230584.1 glycogen/starch/alpha-glucan phosphorylase [Candidatus Omnitrophota bacterium]
MAQETGIKKEAEWFVSGKEMTKDAIKLSFQMNREYTLSKDQYTATMHDNFLALSLAVRERIVERWIKTQQSYHKKNARRVYYLSMEFLIGRLMGNNMYSLGIEKQVAEAMDELGLDLEEVRGQEIDAGLGNGGLGRLAACFLDSMASLGIPAHGYGIRYEYGIFNQKVKNGFQMELPDEWLRAGNPWEFARPEYTVKVCYYGNSVTEHDNKGNPKQKWINTQDVLAVPYDLPVVGYRNDVVNTLRLWSARGTEEFDFDYFKSGDYEHAVYKKILSENISKVLYPSDASSQGKELRLKQEYFFTAASIADIIRRCKAENPDLRDLPKKVVIQLNDTHPTLAIAELMRLLIDEYDFGFEAAWDITTRVFAYTNHTLMPEALECWSVELFERLLPRHMQIIYEINAHFLKEVALRYPGDTDRLRRMSLIEEGDTKRIRMAYLAIVGSFSVNGVSQLHSDLLKANLFKDFYEFYPGKFNNKTNGITQRRWLLKANPRLADLLIDKVGDGWIMDLNRLEKIDSFKNNKAFREKWTDIKRQNKQALARYIKSSMDLSLDPESIFDVQIKRIHEYKRQMLFAFYIIAQYLRLKHSPKEFIYPRTFMVGGKAAPAYYMAKLTIKFINSIAEIINHDKSVKDKIKLVFLENYRVSLAEKVFPASDLSEQISTAGTEASGTGNMKFMMNGALTIGTLDGANIEIAKMVGEESIFIFGLKSDEVQNLKAHGYHPSGFIDKSPMLQEIFKLIRSGFFSPHDANLFAPIIDSLTGYDPYLVCADFDSYCQMQDVVSKSYMDQEEWVKKSIINVAHSGFFSSDRTIREYAKDIWKVPFNH